MAKMHERAEHTWRRKKKGAFVLCAGVAKTARLRAGRPCVVSQWGEGGQRPYQTGEGRKGENGEGSRGRGGCLEASAGLREVGQKISKVKLGKDN